MRDRRDGTALLRRVAADGGGGGGQFGEEPGEHPGGQRDQALGGGDVQPVAR